MENKKAQSSLEFIIILVFILLVVGIVMFAFGQYSVDAKNQEIELMVEDFKKSIDTEIDILADVEEGYSRVVEMPENIMSRFNLTINASEGYMTLTDKEAFGYDTDKYYYYNIPKGYNLLLDPKPGGTYDLILVKGTNYTPKFVDLGSNITVNYPVLTDYQFYWNTSSWSSCSVSCGVGIETRTVECIDRDTNLTVPDPNCAFSKPLDTRSCSMPACVEPGCFVKSDIIDTGNTRTYGSDVKVDNDGNIIAVGTYYTGPDRDVLVVKYDEFLNRLWMRTYDSGFGNDMGMRVGIDNNDSIFTLARKGSGDTSLIKYSEGGDFEWESSYSFFGISNQPTGLHVYDNGESIISGFFDNGANYLMYVLKYDSLGNELWNRTYDYSFTSNPDQFQDIVVDNFGNIYVSGNVWNGVDDDSYLIKLDSSGNILWDTIVDWGFDYEIGLGVTVDGNFVYQTGYKKTGVDDDLFVVKYDVSTGAKIWNKSFENGSWEWGSSLNTDLSGDLLVVGGGGGPGGSDALLVNYRTLDGVMNWNHSIDLGSSSDNFYSSDYDNKGYKYIIGSLSHSPSNMDYYLGKYHNSCEYSWMATPWAACDISGQQTRNAYCINDSTGLTVGNGNCSGGKPVEVRNCDMPLCLVWEREISNGVDESSLSIELDKKHNVYSLGFSKYLGVSDLSLIKYDYLGNLLENKNYSKDNSNYRYTGLMFIDDRGDILVGGRYLNHTAFLSKLDSDYNILWNKSFSEFQMSWMTFIEEDYMGNYYLGIEGWENSTNFVQIIKLNKNGDIIWRYVVPKAHNNISNGNINMDFYRGNLFMAHYIFDHLTNLSYSKIIKFDMVDGSIVDEKEVHYPEWGGFTDIFVDPSSGDLYGSMYLADLNIINISTEIFKFDNNLNLIWKKEYKSKNLDRAGLTLRKKDNHIYVNLISLNESDYFGLYLLKYDTSGNYIGNITSNKFSSKSRFRDFEILDDYFYLFGHTDNSSFLTAKMTDKCNLPTYYSWVAEPWGVCSTGGVEERVVYCRNDLTGGVVSDTNCDISKKPKEIQPCNFLLKTFDANSSFNNDYYGNRFVDAIVNSRGNLTVLGQSGYGSSPTIGDNYCQLFEMDFDGNVFWNVTFFANNNQAGDSDDSCYQVEEVSNGYLVVGYNGDWRDHVPSDKSRATIIKFDKDGNYIDNLTFYDRYESIYYNLIVDNMSSMWVMHYYYNLSGENYYGLTNIDENLTVISNWSRKTHGNDIAWHYVERRDFDNNYLFASSHNGSSFYYNSTISLVNETGGLVWETHIEPTKPNEGVVVYQPYEYDDLTGDFLVVVLYYTTTNPTSFAGFSGTRYIYYYDSSGNYIKNVSNGNDWIEFERFNSSHLISPKDVGLAQVFDLNYSNFPKTSDISDIPDFNFNSWVELPDKSYMFFGEKTINTTDPRYDTKYAIIKANHDFKWNREQITGAWP